LLKVISILFCCSLLAASILPSITCQFYIHSIAFPKICQIEQSDPEFVLWTTLSIMLQIWIFLEIFSCMIIWFIVSTRHFTVHADNLKFLSSRAASSRRLSYPEKHALILKYKSLQIGTNYSVSSVTGHMVLFSVVSILVWIIVYFNYLLALSIQPREYGLGFLILSSSIALLAWMFWILEQAVKLTRLSQSFISSLHKGLLVEQGRQERRYNEQSCKFLTSIKYPLGICYPINKQLVLIVAATAFEFTINFMLI